MIAFLKIANRQPCHSPSPRRESELNICRSRPVLRSSTAEDGGNEALVKKAARPMAGGAVISRAVVPKRYQVPEGRQNPWSRAVNPCQALSGPVKGFSEKKSFFLSPRTALHRVSLFGGGRAARCPHPKSTLPYSKSTLDLGCEGSIWVENGFVMPRSGALRHTFHPITTRPSKTSSQMPTAAKRKNYFPKVDLGCLLFVPFIFQNSKNPAK